VTTWEIIDQIHELIFEYRRNWAKSRNEQLSISRESFRSNNREDLDMRLLTAQFAPKSLNADQKLKRCQWSEQNLELLWGDLNDFLSRLVSINETSLYHNDLEAMQQSMERLHIGST